MANDRDRLHPRVLVVEDNASASNVLRRCLETIGCEVSAEPNGSAALRRARREPPDLIFMDMRLPGLDGLEVLPKLRKTRGLEKVPVICMSGYAYAEMKQEALSLGGTAFLEKPFGLEEIRGIVSSVLGYEPRA